jgi:hypothetical protein
VTEDGYRLEEEAPSPQGAPTWRRRGVVGGSVAVLVALGALVAVAASDSGSGPTAGTGTSSRGVSLPAEHRVLEALSDTTSSGSFRFSYSISSTPATSTVPTTSTTECSVEELPVPPEEGDRGGGSSLTYGGGTGATGSGATGSGPTGSGATGSGATGSGPTGSGSVETPSVPLPPGYRWQQERVCTGAVRQSDPPVTGHGVIDTDPTAMVASAVVGDIQDTTVRLDDAHVYEESAGDTGLAPLSSDPGTISADLPTFAGLTEDTLGPREGAVATIGMAGPTGFLDLVTPAIGPTDDRGTGMVDGVPVTTYELDDDLGQLADAPGTSSAESQTIAASMAVLQAHGYVSDTMTVSVDASGYIRQVIAVERFSDGGTVTLRATFTDFGCAGTVLMPGQVAPTASAQPPADCTTATPDQPAPTSTDGPVGTAPSPTSPATEPGTTTVGTAPTTPTGTSSMSASPTSTTTRP